MRYFRTQHDRVNGSIAASIADIVNHFDAINITKLVYLDDLYKELAHCISGMIALYNAHPQPIVETDMLTSALFSDRHVYFKNHADRQYIAIPECYDRTDVVVQSLYDHADTLSQRIAQVDAMIENMQVLITNNNTSSSIYDEITIYDTCDQFSLITDGSLFRDVHAGCLVLPAATSSVLSFTVESVTVNAEKGSIKKPAFGIDSYDWLPDGYMNAPTVGSTPVFEVTKDAETEYLSDGDPLTMVYRERLSKTPMGRFTMDITLNCAEQDIDALRLICANIGSDAKTEESTYPLSVTDCLVKTTASPSFQSLMTNAIDNRISINGKSIGTSVTDIVNVAGDMYPGAVLYLGAKNVTALKLRITNARSHMTTFKEKTVLDSSGQVLHTFNYPETLFINGYVSDGIHTNPAIWYDTAAKTQIQELIASAANTSDEERIVYRNAIGVREVSLLKCTYATSGDAVSGNLNSTGKQIAACELYTSHIIPDGCTIEYYMSTDLNQWTKIAPKNHPYTDDDTLRLVFDDRLPAVSRDKRMIQATSTVYIKVVMTGTVSITPLLKAYAVRIKHL